MQMVVIETGGRPIIVGGDVAVWFGELDEPHTEGQLRVVRSTELVWLTHGTTRGDPAPSKACDRWPPPGRQIFLTWSATTSTAAVVCLTRVGTFTRSG